MVKALKIVGLLLLLTGIIFFLSQVFSFNANVTRITLPGNIKGFSDIRIANEQDVKAAFAKAETAMNENVASYKKWNSISVFASWAAFFLSSIITLLAGYLGFYKT